MNVLITGGAGFIAHHLIEKILNETDWNVICLDRLDFSGNLNRLHDILQNNTNSYRVRIVYHDLKAELNDMICHDVGQVDYIFHLAAGSHVDRSIENPLEFVYDNVVGTCNILNFARKQNNLKRFVYFSTDEVFGPAEDGVSYKEWDRYNSTNPYSATKAGGEELVLAFRNTYKMPVYITHTMNVFGERQHPEKFIPMCIRKISKGQKVSIHSDSNLEKPGSRHYIHAKDVADALLFVIRNNFDHIKYNFAGDEEIDNLQLAKTIAKAQNKELNYEMVDFHSSRPGHDLRYSLDNSLMRELGWTPKLKFSDRIENVVDWYLNNPRWLMTENQEQKEHDLQSYPKRQKTMLGNFYDEL